MLIEKLEIKGEIDTPYVSLNPETGVCEITGKSYPENVAYFYNRVIDWFEEYTFLGEKDIVLNMHLTYFNSSSQKIFTEIFSKLMDATNFKVTVNWHYDEEDDEILENGKIYASLTDLNFNYIPHSFD